ncbi:hypothetical protein ACFW2V_13810 [Streptomyces sp. NPDC058947]|uniref:hypothetical protein n=1 Tax=Streptomyces sp. NPDC058947 TaxID=3346675 RepID=UPI003698FADE
MSKARRYMVDGDPGPIPQDRPVPTKEQIVVILTAARDSTLTRPALLVAAARLYSHQPDGQRADQATSWARTVLDYPATERLLDGMERDGLLVGKKSYEWAELGHRIGGAQHGTTYYVTARTARAILDRKEHHIDQRLWEQAGAAADERLRALHEGQWMKFRQEAYDTLRRTSGK